jgi:hypothetical protein
MERDWNPDFEWDPRKASENMRRHGVTFQEAASAFYDPLAVEFPDPDHSLEEDRYITIGMSSAGRLLLVPHAHRGDRIRIISARRITRLERIHYEQEK